MIDAVISFFGMSMNPSRSFTIFGISIYWYGALIALGFLAGVVYAFRVGKKYGITSENLTDILIVAVPAAIVGARLFYVVGHINSFAADPASVLRVWEGGLSVFGGIVFALLGIWFYCRKKDVSFLAVLDTAGPALLLGEGISAWGDFVNRQHYGIATSFPWKMGLTIGETTVYVHPLFLYNFLMCMAGFVLIVCLFRKRERRYDGEVFLCYGAWVSLSHVFLQYLRADLSGLIFTRLFAALLFAGSVLLLCWNRFRAEHQPEGLYVHGGAAFRIIKNAKKGRYGNYYDNDIDEEAEAENSAPAPAAEAVPVTEEAPEQTEEVAGETDEEGFEAFVTGSGEEENGDQ